MGLDISKIVNAELKRIAFLKDADANNNLDAEEFALFKAEAAAKEGVSAEDFNQAMGLYTTTPIAKPEEVEDKKVEDKKEEEEEEKKFEDKHSEKRIEKTVFRYLDEISNKSRKDVINALEDKIGLQINNPEYKELLKAVKDVLDVMPNEYTSVDDIKDQRKISEKKLEDLGIKDDLHKDILKKLEKNAEVEVRKAATKKVKELYTRFEKVEDGKPEKTIEQVMNEVKAELEAKEQFKDEVKDAFKDYEKTTIQKNARKLVEDAIKEVKDFTKRKDVAKKAKEILVADGNWDKYTEKELKQSKWYDIFTGKERYGKKEAKRQATHNNIEEKKHQTKEEVLDKLGEKSTVYEALVNSGLISVDEKDNVDLSILSDIVGLQVGADHCLNRHAKIDKAISEKFRLNSALAMKTNLESMTEKEAKKLAELTGYDIEGKDIRRILIGAIEGLLAGAALGAAAAKSTPRQTVLVEGDTINHELNLILKGDIGADALGNLPEGVTVTDTGAGIAINIAQTIINPDRLIGLPKLVGEMAWKTGLMSAALGALKGLEDEGEEPVTVTNFLETTFEDYIKRTQWELKKLGRDELIEGFTCLAASFIREDGSWDKAGYLDKLSEIGGDGGKININEAPTTCQTNKVKDSKKENDQNKTNPMVITQGEKETTTKIIEEIQVDIIPASHSTWTTLASQYECLSTLLDSIPDAKTKYPFCYQYRHVLDLKLLKVAQAVTKKEVFNDVDKLLYLAEEAYKSPDYEYRTLVNCDYIDFKNFQEVMKKRIVETVKMPPILAGCSRVEKPTADNRYKNNQSRKKEIPYNPAGTYGERLEISGKYGYRINNGEIIPCESAFDRDQKVKKTKEENEAKGIPVIIEKVQPYDEFAR